MPSESPGRPVGSNYTQLLFEKSLNFYRDVFDWTTQQREAPEPIRFESLGEGNDAVAGIMDVSSLEGESQTAHWVVYFQVENCDETVARAVELGGSISNEPHDSDYGRLAGLVDSSGARFKVFSPIG